ncbi:hypothetical protein PN36_12820 [Candidatus Thiomargarita nelsonii]|uniref:Uncharacterized protein n=1 Tax=Candidatus Thiomargarita nelsonii TaxID=1003181 RepID=A0A0A6RSN2_9GAMM|nr:hypothetical protein PN36_12820 [Candidatus Thiomargarita nelsonii]
MQAIEFTCESHDGVIKIPEQYKDWFNKSVKVILLWQEQRDKTMPQSPTVLNRFAGTISLTEDPLEFQKRIRGE